jgi:glutamine amidotransferase
VVRLEETGLDRAIHAWIGADRPFFGICLGLQALFEYSEEGKTPGLGVFPGQVLRFQLPESLKIPHMGWNATRFRESGPLVRGLSPGGEHFYYVHSYFAQPREADLIWCEANYGGNFCAGIRRGNCLATQFHPEKSQAMGLRLYHNFLDHVVSLRTTSQ